MWHLILTNKAYYLEKNKKIKIRIIINNSNSTAASLCTFRWDCWDRAGNRHLRHNTAQWYASLEIHNPSLEEAVESLFQIYSKIIVSLGVYIHWSVYGAMVMYVISHKHTPEEHRASIQSIQGRSYFVYLFRAFICEKTMNYACRSYAYKCFSSK